MTKFAPKQNCDSTFGLSRTIWMFVPPWNKLKKTQTTFNGIWSRILKTSSTFRIFIPTPYVPTRATNPSLSVIPLVPHPPRSAHGQKAPSLPDFFHKVFCVGDVFVRHWGSLIVLLRISKVPGKDNQSVSIKFENEYGIYLFYTSPKSKTVGLLGHWKV